MSEPLTGALGAYYTTPETAAFLARWVLAGGARSVLEPSFGDGVFLAAVGRADPSAALHGVELRPCAHGRAVAEGLVAPERAVCGDFLQVPPFPVDAVLGNPPYVRLRHLPPGLADAAMGAAEAVLGQRMQTSGSVWMPFVLHAARFLRPGGRMALVLPFDLTYVRYARPLWAWLGAHFGSLRLLRVRERIFPDILQQVVLLLADDRGGRADRIRFEAYETVAALTGGRPRTVAEVEVERVVAGKRDFQRAHLPGRVRELLTGLEPQLAPVRALCGFHIGYVTGHKAFFHPDPEAIDQHALPAAALRPALTSSRQLTGRGLYTSGVPDASADRLFHPDPAELSAGERGYLAAGEGAGVAQRYKCRVRDPWFVVPDVRVPDLVLSVFSERPVLLLNDRRYVASNSLLVGFLRGGRSPDAFVTGWYTSLTRLSCELEVHALGGGVMVLVPGEVGRIQVAADPVAQPDHLQALDALLAANDPDGAYRLGDRVVLADGLGLSCAEIDAVRDGICELAAWRTGAERGGRVADGVEAPTVTATR